MCEKQHDESSSSASADLSAHIPRKYGRAFIDVSRRGVDGFDFSRFNRTSFGGLENALRDASYTNAVLLMLWFVPELRRCVLREQFDCKARCVAAAAVPGAKLALELSLLFYLLDCAPRLPAHKRAVHSANCISALRQAPDAVALSLVGDESGTAPADSLQEPKRKPLARKSRALHRFLLQQLDAHLSKQGVATQLYGLESVATNEFLTTTGSSSPSRGAAQTTPNAENKEEDDNVEKRRKPVAGCEQRCSKALTTELCLEKPFHHVKTKRRLSVVETWTSGDVDESCVKDDEEWLFCDAVHASLCRSTRARAWRESARRYEPIAQSRTPRPALPLVLALHCDVGASAPVSVHVPLLKDEPRPPWCRGAPWFAKTFKCRVDTSGKCQVFEKTDAPTSQPSSDNNTKAPSSSETPTTESGTPASSDAACEDRSSSVEWLGAGDACVEKEAEWAEYELVSVLSHVQRYEDRGDACAPASDDPSAEGLVLHARVLEEYTERADESQQRPSSYAAAMAMAREDEQAPSRRRAPRTHDGSDLKTGCCWERGGEGTNEFSQRSVHR